MTAAATDLRERLRACSSAEDYFALLDVPFDPHVVAVNRLHILRHFAGELDRLGALDPEVGPDPEQLAVSCRQALARSYRAFTTGTALDHRLFKVLRDRAPEAFVAIADVAVERAGSIPAHGAGETA